MAHVRRTLPVVVFVVGVILVFSGLNAAVDLSAAGMFASAAAVLALLYSGAVWFGSRQPAPPVLDTVIVFDRSLREACGARRGLPVTASFPVAERAALEDECWGALAGEGGRFSAGDGRSQFDVLPVRTADGAITYGILIDVAARHRVLSSPAETA
jgi:hypothetical protein